jgi:NitT/TauT family transport system substrate-binding protein
MNLIRFCFPIQGLLLVAMALGSGCADRSKEITIALSATSLNFSAVYVAEDMGFWKDAGVHVKLDLNWPGTAAINAALAGKVDFACVPGAPLLHANARGQKLVAIANISDRLNAEIVLSPAFAERAHLRADATVEERCRALRGARIAVDTPNGMPHSQVKYAARRAGLDADRDLVVTPIAYPAMLPALRSGQVDGMAAGPPWSTMARKEGLAVMIVNFAAGDFPELSPFNNIMIGTRPGFCESRKETCRNVVAGVKRALVFMHERPDETVALLQKRFERLDPALVKEVFGWVLEATPRSAVIGETGFAHAQDFLIGAKVLQESEKLSSFASLYTNDYAR